MTISKYLKENILLTDGAMGTYYNEISSSPLLPCPVANIENPREINRIHTEYIEAGARLIRTNTFSANTVVLNTDISTVKTIIKEGCKIAKAAAESSNIYIAASIGPIPDSPLETDHMPEYIEIADTFLSENIDIFMLETFYSLDYIKELSEYIKSKNSAAFIIAGFSLTDTGVTKKSLSVPRIISELENFKPIDMFGFNCGVGPAHMLNIIDKLPKISKYIFALPNAGYPELIDNKTEYVMSPKYFAKMCAKMTAHGIKMTGGCCGTTPTHIKLLNKALSDSSQIESKTSFVQQKDFFETNKIEKNEFHKKLENNKFIIAVELDPPFKPSIDRVVKGASELKKNGADIITIADSPMGKCRADSIIISAKIKRESGIETLPHICCRDKNSISLRSAILGAYIEGIRNFLVVTGDPIPGELKEDVKSVFNLNSYTLMNMITEMNHDIFTHDPVKIGGAANFNVKNKDSEYKRLLKKAASGAEFFLTQPVFTDDTINYIKNIKKDGSFKILAGIMPLVSFRNAQFINNELPGITIPEHYISLFNPEMTREEAEETGINIAVEIVLKIKPYVDGFYIMTPFNRYEMIISILKKAGIA